MIKRIYSTNALLLLISLLMFLMYFNFTIDDAFISYRYAENFAKCNGLVYNIGEKVEGFSNFSWVMILSLPAKLGLSSDLSYYILPVFSKITSWFFVIFIVFLIGRTKSLKQESRNTAKFIFVLYPSLWVWCNSGLETVFYSFLLYLFFWTIAERKKIFGKF